MIPLDPLCDDDLWDEFDAEASRQRKKDEAMRKPRTIVFELSEGEARWLQRALENYSFQELADEDERSFKRDLWDGIECALAENPPHAPRTKCPQKRFNPP